MKFVATLLLILTAISWSCGNSQQEGKVHNTVTSRLDTLNLIDSSKHEQSVTITSNITCPKCGTTSEEIMPTEVCQLAYTCKNCKTVMHPQGDDCCVFCTYGDHKCPSKQD